MRKQPNTIDSDPVPNLYDSPLGQTVNTLMVAVPVTLAVGA